MCLKSLPAAHMHDDQYKVIKMYDIKYTSAHGVQKQASNVFDRTN